MPTDVIKKIGATNTPTTMDYSTLAAWIAACPANLVTADQRWIGECYDQGELVVAAQVLNITGITVDATRYIILRCATGASFKDKAGVRTTALFYNASNGAAVRSTGNYHHTISCAVDYTQLIGLQVQNDESNSGDYALNWIGGANCTIDNCIIRGGTGGRIVKFTGKLRNSLCIGRSSSNLGVIAHTPGNPEAHGNTIVSTTASSQYGIGAGYNAVLSKNNAVFGYAAFTGGSGLAAASDYNATDLSSIGTGTHNQVSLTFASQFQSSSNDFRAISSGSLNLNGAPDATNLANDISGTARSLTTPTIGCWEVVTAAASAHLLSLRRRMTYAQ